MILVTLGTQDKSFKRLLDAIQLQIDNKVITEKVIVQAGHTKYQSTAMEIFDLIPTDEFEKLISECSLLITHGGVGTIISGLNHNKKVIAAARLKKYGEHTNDHQLQIIEKFENEGYILNLSNFNKLDKIIELSSTFVPRKYSSNNENMVKLITKFIEKNK